MSCPSCQVAGRRLPSLPLAYVAKSKNGSLSKLKSYSNALESASFQIERLSLKGSVLNRMQSSSIMGMDNEVEKYLQNHPQVIEDYIKKNVSREQLERWLIRKSKASKGEERCKSGSENLRSFSNWKFCVHKDKRKLLETLTGEINKEKNKTYVINELVKSIGHAIHASRHNLYLVDGSRKFLQCYSDSISSVEKWPHQEIDKSKTIAAYVAREKDLVYVTEILGDERFPGGTGRDGVDQSVICYPMSSSNGQLFGVAEFVRDATGTVFGEEDLEVACSYLTWGSIAIHYAEIAMKLEMHSETLDFVNTCASSIAETNDDPEIVFKYIGKFVKEITNSDHFNLYLHDDKTRELFSHHTDFITKNADEKTEEEMTFRVPRDEGIPGHVIKTAKLWNVKDAYAEKCFSRALDQKIGYTTKTILAAPIFVKKKALGVIELINKANGIYNDQDEETVKLCASFYGLAWLHQQQRAEVKRRSQEVCVLEEIMTYHGRPRRKELREVVNPSIVMDIPDDFYKFSFNFYRSSHQNGKWCFQMSKDIFDKCQVSYCEKSLVRFLATVKKHYRDNPYHNWDHAFSVAHFCYLMLQNIHQKLTDMEIIALFFGCLCHDLDHRGRNNAFVILTNQPLAKLYDVNVLENHHYYMTKHILEQPECDIFSSFNNEEKKEVMNLIKEAILATDLMEYFKNRNILGPIVKKGTFDWKIKEHRKLATSLIMTNCDLCGSCKAYEISKISAHKVFEEFYAQGDEELRLGYTPIPMFTRKDEMALNQAGFLNAVVMPCVLILKKIIPPLVEVENQIKLLLDQWEDYAKENVEKEMSEEEIKQLRIPGSQIQENSLSFVKYN